MVFLVTIVTLTLFAERYENFVLPAVAIIIRGFYRNGQVVIGRLPAIVALATFALFQISLYFTEPRTLQDVFSDWTVMKLSLSVFMVMVCLQNFYSDYTDNERLPQFARTFIFHMVRAFTVLRSQGEEGRYTSLVFHKYIVQKSAFVALPIAVTTYLTQIIRYIDNRTLVMDSRGGFPAITLWKGAGRRELDHWGDWTLIALVVLLAILEPGRLFPTYLVDFFQMAFGRLRSFVDF